MAEKAMSARRAQAIRVKRHNEKHGTKFVDELHIEKLKARAHKEGKNIMIYNDYDTKGLPWIYTPDYVDSNDTEKLIDDGDEAIDNMSEDEFETFMTQVWNKQKKQLNKMGFTDVPDAPETIQAKAKADKKEPKKKKKKEEKEDEPMPDASDKDEETDEESEEEDDGAGVEPTQRKARKTEEKDDSTGPGERKNGPSLESDESESEGALENDREVQRNSLEKKRAPKRKKAQNPAPKPRGRWFSGSQPSRGDNPYMSLFG